LIDHLLRNILSQGHETVLDFSKQKKELFKINIFLHEMYKKMNRGTFIAFDIHIQIIV